MKAVLITGNPKYITNNPTAKLYYKAIVDFVRSLGVDCTTDPGKDFTCPPKADFYIAHSRGCERFRCVKDDPILSKRFLRFGNRGGVNHPVDAVWMEKATGTPPPEHFIFTDEQKLAINAMVMRVGGELQRRPNQLFEFPVWAAGGSLLKDILAEAVKDPELGSIVTERATGKVTAFLADYEVVGFAIPRKDPDGYYRTGPIYVTPKHRKRGIASAFIAEYFKGKKGRAWISNSNTASMALYAKNGFRKTERVTTVDGDTMSEWIKG